jgi:hypothetical protein
MKELSLMKEIATKDMIRRFMLYIYILIVVMIMCCFVIALDVIGYVIDSVRAVEFSTCIFSIV